MESNLDNKHILITGASGGIGLAVVKKFLDEGAKVTAQYKDNTLLLPSSDRMTSVSVDLRDKKQISSLFKSAIEFSGRIDCLVCCAGIWPSEYFPIQNLPFERWQNIIEVNLTSVYLCVKFFLQNLAEHNGEEASIILIGSTAGVFGEAGHAAYSTTKAALRGLMLTIKNEIPLIARRGRVNLINPGWTYTPMAEESLKNSDEVKKILQTVPLRKIALANDIANMTIILASDTLAGHITGQEITIAGGMEGRVLYQPKDIDLSRIRG